ncbi:MAG: translation initiation factor IF-2 [Candidatus Eisenbacteria sp.]|nr:translation initiation factor IF-2 [Candidatus Eisenbacteria bacterium]
MRKVRVYQLARELKTSNEVVMEILETVGVSVNSHASAVDSSVADQVRHQLAGVKRSAGREVGARGRAVKSTHRTELAAAATAPESAPVQVWSLDTLPQAPDVSIPTLDATASAAPPAPPPARRVGPAVPARGDTPSARTPIATPRKEGRGRSSTVDVTRTYRPRGPSGASKLEPASGPGMGGPAKPGRPGWHGGPRVGGGKPGRKGKRKRKQRQVDERELLESVRKTMATLDGGSRPRKRRKVRREDGTEVEEEITKIRINEYATVSELSSVLDVRPNEVVVTCLRLGVIANINRRLDRDTIEAVADEFNLEVEFVKEYGDELIEEIEDQAEAVPEVQRPPIVTVMGHVDHGKTKLLDYIRSSDVISGESGGITQHIGAYQARLENDKLVTFLDTPGHQAFTQMRARGADVTDIVVLVVAADNRVNEQTIEAINHARAARKPIIIAINKCDLPAANPEKIKQQLSEQGLLVEDWGGEIVAVEISAKQGTNVDKLLEMILLVAEIQELKAQRDRAARATVIEAKKDPGRGIIATVLIQSGTLRIGDAFVCGTAYGKVRAMTNERGDRLESAVPSTPVEVMGWSEVPQTGDTLTVVKSDSVARMIAAERTLIARAKRMRQAASRFRLGELHTRIKEQQRIDLRVIIKADVQGSVEVLRDSLEKLSDEQVTVVIIHTGVGRINESDVLLAAASGAVIIGFHVRPDPKATQLAQDEDTEIRLYRVIYEAIDELKAAKAGLLKPKEIERVLGSAEVREVFQVTKVGTVAGSHVVAGKITRQARVRLIRNEDVIWTGKVASLKRFKEDTKEVATGFDCGIMLDGFGEIQVGDLIEAFVVEEISSAKP